MIIQEGHDVTFIRSSGDTVKVIPDGEPHTQQTLAGQVEIQATWKNLSLEVKTRRPSGPEMTRRYRISDEGRLEVVALPFVGRVAKVRPSC